MINSKYNRWKTRFEHWQRSPKNQRAWSIEAGLPYGQVLYWFKKFAEEKSAVKFIEVREAKKSSSGVAIQFGKWTISLQKDFDKSTLIQCLQTLEGK